MVKFVFTARRRRFPRPPGWGVALVGAVLVAEAAVWVLRPRDGIIAPVPVSARSYFSEQQLDHARDFRRPQLALHGATLFVQLGVLALLVRRPPRRLRGPFRRPVLAAAAAGAALSVAVEVAALPLGAVMRERAKDVGLVTQSWAGWAGDVGKGLGIGMVIAGAGAATGVGLMRRFRRAWWLPASGVVVAFGTFMVYAGPVVLDPLFNRFDPLPEGRTRTDVLELARRAGVEVGEVLRVDASRRTTAANAYVAGLGTTKRVVLYDTLLENFTRDEVNLVVAHELGHVHYRDVPNGLLFLALVAPAGLFAVARLTARLTPVDAGTDPVSARGRAPAGPSVLPALALSLAVVVTPVSWISNTLSRRVEARADAYSLRLTRASNAFISFEKRIALRNVADPDPPGWVTAVLSTHPSTVQRIGIGEAFARRARSPGVSAR